MSDISGDLMSHLRYPEDLFKVQRELLARYHVTDAGSFYGGQDFWKVPEDPTQEQRIRRPAAVLPDARDARTRTTPHFSLTTTFMPFGDRQVLSGFLAVDANAGTDGRASERAATARCGCSSCPRTATSEVPARCRTTSSRPTPTAAAFSLTLSQFLNNARQQGSSVTLGNLLTLPVGGGLLYVEPIYVQANTQSAYPLSGPSWWRSATSWRGPTPSTARSTASSAATRAPSAGDTGTPADRSRRHQPTPATTPTPAPTRRP